MTKQRGSPDRRGMGAPSDLVSQSFVPDAAQTAERTARARVLLGIGLPLEQVAEWLNEPVDSLAKAMESDKH